MMLVCLNYLCTSHSLLSTSRSNSMSLLCDKSMVFNASSQLVSLCLTSLTDAREPTPILAPTLRISSESLSLRVSKQSSSLVVSGSSVFICELVVLLAMLASASMNGTSYKLVYNDLFSGSSFAYISCGLQRSFLYL